MKRALIDAGYTALTDLNISRNDDFSDAIDSMIRTAKLTMVLWTKASAKSNWVRKEAQLAYDLEQAGKPNKYLGVMLENVDLDLPLELRGLQMVDLNPDGLDASGLDKLISEAHHILGADVQQNAQVAETDSQSLTDEWQLYEMARSINVAASYERYLDRYPKGEFADDARRQLNMFKWYLHPFRRGNVANTLAALGIVGTVTATIWAASGQPGAMNAPSDANTVVIEERDAAVANVETLEAENAANADALETLEEQVQSLQNRLDQEKRSFLALRADRDEGLKVIEGLGSTLADAQRRVREAEEARSLAETAERAANDQATALRSVIDEARERLDATADERDAAKEQIEKLQKEQSNSEEAMQRAEAARQEAERATRDANDQINVLKARVEELLASSEKTRSTECQTDNKPGVLLTEIDRCIALDTRTLDLSGTDISDLSALASLVELKILDLTSTQVTDLSPLSSLTTLERLDLEDTSVADILPLQNLSELEHLILNLTSLSDLSALSNLKKLRYLSIGRTDVTDVRPLANLTSLRILGLHATEVTDLSPLANLSELTNLLTPDVTLYSGRDEVAEAIRQHTR